MARRRDVFPPDRMLQLRMAVALAVQLTLVAALVAATVWLLVHGLWGLVVFLVGIVVAGFARSHTSGHRRRRRGRSARPGRAEEERDLRIWMDRLAAQGGLRAPQVTLETDNAPLSWTTAVPWRRPSVHVTTGLLDRLDRAGVEAVLAHELAHVAHRDAMVMTLVAGPPAAMLAGVRVLWDERDNDILGAICAVLMFGAILVPAGLVLTLSARVVSRHRELAADRAAAVLTGSPAAVAAALVQVSDGLERLRRRDLRAVASRDPFHFVPARDVRGIRRLWATHPRLERRVARLERLESRLQDNRR